MDLLSSLLGKELGLQSKNSGGVWEVVMSPLDCFEQHRTTVAYLRDSIMSGNGSLGVSDNYQRVGSA